jgi:hypothetical protein
MLELTNVEIVVRCADTNNVGTLAGQAVMELSCVYAGIHTVWPLMILYGPPRWVVKVQCTDLLGPGIVFAHQDVLLIPSLLVPDALIPGLYY